MAFRQCLSQVNKCSGLLSTCRPCLSLNFMFSIRLQFSEGFQNKSLICSFPTSSCFMSRNHAPAGSGHLWGQSGSTQESLFNRWIWISWISIWKVIWYLSPIRLHMHPYLSLFIVGASWRHQSVKPPYVFLIVLSAFSYFSRVLPSDPFFQTESHITLVATDLCSPNKDIFCYEI